MTPRWPVVTALALVSTWILLNAGWSQDVVERDQVQLGPPIPVD